MKIIVTGGCGFIGSNFIKYIINKKEINSVLNIDTVSKYYGAANIKNTDSFKNNIKYKFEDFWLETLDNPIEIKKFKVNCRKYYFF